MKKVDFNKLQAGDLVEVPRTQFAPMRSGWNGWLFSEAVVIRKGVGRKSKRNVVVGFELYEWQRLYIITGIWQPPEGRLHGRTTAYILRLLLDQSKPLLLYEFSQVAAYADNPFMGRQYQPVPMQYVGWFRHEIRSIYEQLRAAGVPVREMITEQQRVISR